MASIGDVFMRMLLQTGEFEASARKEGAKAGEAAGKEMSSSLMNTLKRGVAWGAGFDIGRRAVHAVADAIEEVVSAIPDMIESGKQFALTVDDLSDKTGASAETASRFAGSLQFLGISTSGLGMSLKTLSTEIVTSEDKFKKLGIQTRDSNGNLLDTITILNNVRGFLSGAGDGATKMALAADLLGRSAGELIDFLNLTDEQAAALTATMDDLGVTIGEKARRDAEALARETNLLGLAWQGLSNMLAAEVMPAIRGIIGGLTAFIKENGAQIKQTFLDITQAVLGFVSGLVGLEGITPFQSQLDSLAGSGGDVTLSFEQWAQQMGLTIPKLEKVASGSGKVTTAVDRQIKTTDKAIAAEKRRADGLLDAIDAQEKQLDLAEQQINIDERRRDLNDQLNEAQLSLTEAQSGRDAQGVSDAMAKIADIQEEQAKNEHDLGVDAQRDKLQMQRDEIEAKSQAKQDELQGLKDQLQEQRAAISAAGSGQKSDNAKLLVSLKAQYQTYLDGEVTATKSASVKMSAEIGGDAAKGTGIGGAITKAFTDGKAAGEGFRAFITDDLVPAIKGLFQVFFDIKTKIDEIANSDIWKFLTDPVDLGSIPPVPGGPGSFDQGDINRRRGTTGPGEIFLPPAASPSSLRGMSGFMGGVPLNVTVVSVLDGREVARSTGRVFADELRH